MRLLGSEPYPGTLQKYEVKYHCCTTYRRRKRQPAASDLWHRRQTVNRRDRRWERIDHLIKKESGLLWPETQTKRREVCSTTERRTADQFYPGGHEPFKEQFSNSERSEAKQNLETNRRVLHKSAEKEPMFWDGKDAAQRFKPSHF